MSNPQTSRQPLSHTLWSPIDTVKDVADSLGLSDLNDETSRNLAMDVEYRIHEILEQAHKFMRHSKRKTLTTNDISKALRILNVEPLYGYDVSRDLKFKEALISNGQTLYYVDEEEMDLEKLINQPLPKVPRQCNFTAHWLAIEGVQPLIPQNPLISDVKQIVPAQRGAITNILTSESSYHQASTNGGNNGVNGADSNASGSTGTGTGTAGEANGGNTAAGSIQTAVDPGNTNAKDIEIKPLVKHVLSKELQVYFNKVIQALSSQAEDDALKNAALSSIRSDPGLHQLIPYFIQFISEQITHNLNDLSILITMLELIFAILDNANIFLDPYIHSLIPSILTLLIAKRIGENKKDSGNKDQQEAGQDPGSNNNNNNNNHFAVRDYAASLLEHVCQKFCKSYTTLKPRVTRTLLKAFLDSNKPVGTIYGSLIGLRIMGSEVIRLTLLGNLKDWSKVYLVNPNLNSEDKERLIATVISNLIKLTDDLNKSTNSDDGDIDMESELNEEQLDRLKARIGDILADAVAKNEKNKLIYDAVFFGELQ
ncbi:hypothetical protein WICPIJ_009719 [Wickerhamomyces pijperi]|uniref:TBP-associated factor 6 n=1 Tax=Wickerhamomyces pijperi TaxID=599730 RepID=A0A9P8PLI9_WICPI|nr:hypothetical protein WICPIJ_009719 [Wickerhamomyces pijperi]